MMFPARKFPYFGRQVGETNLKSQQTWQEHLTKPLVFLGFQI